MIGTLINYCSNEKRFLRPCIEQAKKFSQKIIVSVCDHFFDGTEENKENLKESFLSFPEVTFVLYPYLPDLKLLFSSLESHFWHSLSRFLGFQFFEKSIEGVLFLDVDEIVEGERFYEWLKDFPYAKFSAITLANYWYFREPCFQALAWEDSCVFAKRKKISSKILLQKDERRAIYHKLRGKKANALLGIDGKPMIHHYSWVRTKEEMLTKVLCWGHCKDRNWKVLVEEEFSREFQGRDFVHGYDFFRVEPFIDFVQKKTNQNKTTSLDHVIFLSPEEVYAFLKIKGPCSKPYSCS